MTISDTAEKIANNDREKAKQILDLLNEWLKSTSGGTK